MTQYVINIGALPNDGTGDPLRTAFNETNLNFDQVFAAGPVGSNVSIANNTILTVNTNGNLVLAPNGTGVVQANVHIVPNLANIRNLGAADRRWSTIYAQYIDTNQINLGNSLVLSGNLSVGGNLSVTGDIVYIGNLVTDAKTIQLANTAGTANAADGSGITVGANDAIATFLFDSATNTWDTNIGLAVNGNITGTGLAVSDATVYGNVNAINGNFTSNIVVNTVQVGTIQLNSVVGPNTLSNITVVDDTVFEGNVDVDGTLFVMGNVSADYFIGDGSQLTGLPASYANANAVAYGQAGWAGNIIPASSNTYSLGNSTNWWSNVWVAGNTIYIGGVPLGMSAGNVLTVGGDAVLSNDSNTSISTTGNITANTFIGDGSQLTGISGGITFEYDIGNFTANALPAAGTMQFTNRSGEVVSPELGNKLWINATDDTGLNTGSTWLAMSQNSERGTVILQQGGDQLPYRVSNIGVYNTPELYRGYRAGVNQIWGDDPSINQIIISNAVNPVFYNENFDIENDVFHATNLADATAVYMVNVYGSNEFNPLSQTDLWSFFTSFVDNVIYQGTDTETLDVTEIRTAFYTNFNNFYNSVNTTAYDQNFRFASSTTYYNSAEVFGEVAGSGARLRVRLNTDYTYTIMGVAVPGTNYQVDDVLVVLGEDLGGASPTNDITLTVSTVDGNGGITAVVINSGVAAYPWRSNSISDGGDDQYDTGNRINTNLAQGIIYAGGNVTAGTTTFGTDSEYAVMYNNSIFCMVATGVGITDLYYSGNLGSDGEGFLRWSGLRSPNSAIAVRYAYMDCEPGTGNLEVAVGPTYQVALDSGGINFDGFYSYLNDANGDWYFGADRDWRLESRAQLAVQSYSTLDLRTLIPIEAAGMSSPGINISTDTGSDGNGQFNQQAGSGGSISIRAGDAGDNDNVPTLGNNGGEIAIIAGAATGNGQVGGGVLIEAGNGDGGTAGNLTLRTRSGVTANGAIVLETNNLDNQKFWIFNSAGSTIFPTLTVTRGDTTGTLTGQALLFGDSTQEAIISTPNGTNDINSSQRFVINPGAGAANTTGEGGDIYLYAGRGGDAGGSGGDIKIRGGLGPVNGDGGYITMEGGEADVNGVGGYIEIYGGQSGNSNGGYLDLRGGLGQTEGGAVFIQGGQGQAGPGGPVNITGGVSGNGLAEYGNVGVIAGASGWVFDNTGNLALPRGGIVYETNIPGGGLDGNTIALKPSGGTNADQQLLVYPTAGNVDANHLHLTSGNLYNTELFLGNDDLYVKLANTGNIVINSNDGTGNTAQWTFDAAGNLTVPGNIIMTTGIVGSGASPAPTLSGFSSVSAIAVNASGNISATGNVTGNYFIGNGSQLTGIAASYGNANVTTFLAAYGSNTISTTGNITGGNLIASATIYGNVDVVLGNTANASSTKTRMVTDTTFSYIQTGNGTVGSTGNIVFSPYSSTTQRVVIDTASGNLTAAGNVTAQNFIGNISITGNVIGTSANVQLVAGSYTATFDNTGILTLPTMGGDEGGEINLGIPATNTTLTTRVVVDVFQDRVRFFDGSTKGAYIDLSQATTGVGTLLNNRVSGLVNAGTFVTMDLIKATVTTSGQRALSLATTTGTLTYNIGGTYALSNGTVGGASAQTQTLTTSATTSIFGWSFPNAGDTATYILTDTTNSRAYRITLMIGASYNNNMITIERLI
jgi:hypothetical protein